MVGHAFHTLALACGLSAVMVLTGCDAAKSPATHRDGHRADATAAGTAAPGTASPSEGQSAGSPGAADFSTRTVALDPGHNGGNASHLDRISRRVSDGHGGTKACNSTGTATAGGFEEHAFNWRVSTALRRDLRTADASVVMSRSSDKGVGPCVDKRGKFASKAGADVLLSIHANGSDSRKTTGFHIIVSPTAGKPKASKRLARAMVKGLKTHGFKPNKAYGKSGLSVRSDLAGLENAKVPAVIVECGEMNNPAQAKVMKSQKGQQRYAAGLQDGLGRYFDR